MVIAYHPGLIERAVFDIARQDATLQRQYEREFADCYECPPGDQRELRFARMHERWFSELGLRELVARVAGEFSHILEHVSRLMVIRAADARAQTVELFGTKGRYTVVVAVAPAILLDRAEFEYWARHELLHVDDMLDPAFGFDSADRPTGATPAAGNLARDRYAVLWAVSVDARLCRRGHAPAHARERRRTEFVRAFSLTHVNSAVDLFDRVWAECELAPPGHRKLMSLALGGLANSEVAPDSAVASGNHVLAGAACPLCGFPTHDWADAPESGPALASIQHDFPSWTPAHGICGRCVEVYRASNRLMETARV